MTWSIDISGRAPIGSFKKIEVEENIRTCVDGVDVTWSRFYLERIRLEHPTHLFLLEGAPVMDLFQAGALALRGVSLVPGPFLYLRGRMSPPWESPGTLNEVTLGRVTHVSGDVRIAAVLAALVATLLR